MTALDESLAWLRAQGPAMEALLGALVETTSYTADRAGVNAAGALLRAAVPLTCEVVEGERYGDHLLFHNGRRAGDPGVVIVGHHDTVFPKEVFAGWHTEARHGFGPGCFDMKGGLVVIAFALKALETSGLLERVPLSFVSVADEEVGSPESRAALAHLAKGADAALVFEAGRAGDAIITRRKGTATVVAHAKGKAAHAGNARSEGASAVVAMARFILAAEALNDASGEVTVNVGRVFGGTSKNTVPAECTADLDARFVTAAQGEALLEALRAAAEGAAIPGTSIALTGGVSRAPLERTVASAALREAYARCQTEAGLGDGEHPLVGGGSDASTTASVGVPSIDGLGPRGAGFHTRDERVDLDSLAPKAEALARYLASRAEL